MRRLAGRRRARCAARPPTSLSSPAAIPVGRPPCVDALIAAGIARVVCSTIDPNPKVAGEGIGRLEAAGSYRVGGRLAEEARALNPGYFSRLERGRPWVRLKLAMSLDARTALAGGGKMWISGERSRADVQHLAREQLGDSHGGGDGSRG